MCVSHGARINESWRAYEKGMGYNGCLEVWLRYCGSRLNSAADSPSWVCV